ncbi:MAG: hypothetical protein GWN79_05265, partial [Actinobacteria bacterium]|nr:hypothetical protein [Actinomycetota bacterium]NIS30116.1 hypothetical protein [Actinomycetota bacterium]NIT94876.1 hypothetical protein [Actinomycetota bacterium]NIU18529.1 hypothetical protein [Actinomycetota bacterium]NIU65375.1 hypothetical protein [Actinomycetota bacterium]
MTVTFCRLRPANRPGVAWAEARRTEGATVAELSAADSASLDACRDGGLLPVAVGHADPGAAGWVLPPAAALDAAAAGAPGWRIT